MRKLALLLPVLLLTACMSSPVAVYRVDPRARGPLTAANKGRPSI